MPAPEVGVEFTAAGNRQHHQLSNPTNFPIGLVVGVIAKLLTPGKDPMGFVLTILLGIAGSFVGTFIGPSG